MWALVLAALLLLGAAVPGALAVPRIININPGVLYEQLPNNTLVPHVDITFTMACLNGEEMILQTDELYQSGVLTPGNYLIKVHCGTVEHFRNIQVKTHVPAITAKARAESETTASIPTIDNALLARRRDLFDDNYTVEEVEAATPGRRRSIGKRATEPCAKVSFNDIDQDTDEADLKCFLNTQCTSINAGDSIGGTLATVGPAFALLAAPMPQCQRVFNLYIAKTQGTSTACSHAFDSANVMIMNKCILSTTLVAYEASFEKQKLIDALNAIKSALNTTLKQFRTMQAAFQSLQTQVDFTNDRLNLLQESIFNIYKEISGLASMVVQANYGAQQNAANNQFTQLAANANAQQAAKSVTLNQNTFKRMSNQIRDLNNNLIQNQKDIVQAIDTRFDVVLQQVSAAMRKSEHNMLFSIRDLRLQLVDSVQQINNQFEGVQTILNRLIQENERRGKTDDLMFNAFKNITAFELQNGNLPWTVHRLYEQIYSQGFIPLLTDLGRPPRNLSEWNVIGRRIYNVQTYLFINPSNDTNTLCDEVFNGKWRTEMDEYYLTEAIATFKVPVERLREYVRFGDQVRITSSAGKLVSGSTCSSCALCANGGTRACFCNGGSCPAAVGLHIINAAEAFTNAFDTGNRTATDTNVIEEGDEVVLMDSAQRLFFIVDADSSNFTTGGSGCYEYYNDFFGVYTPIYDQDQATWVVVKTTAPDPTFPWLSVNDNVYLVPKLAYDAVVQQKMALGTTYSGGGYNYTCIEHDNSTTESVTIDNSADVNLRRRDARKTVLPLAKMRAERNKRHEAMRERTRLREEFSTVVKRPGKRAIKKPTFSVFQRTGANKRALNNMAGYPPDTRYLSGGWTPSDLSFGYVPPVSQLRQVGSGARNFSDSCPYGAVLTDTPKKAFLYMARDFEFTPINDTITGYRKMVKLEMGASYRFGAEETLGLGYLDVPMGMLVEFTGERINAENSLTYKPQNTITYFSMRFHGPGRNHMQIYNTYALYGLVDWKPDNGTGILYSATLRVVPDPENNIRYTMVCMESPPSDYCPPRLATGTFIWKDLLLATNVYPYGASAYPLQKLRFWNYMRASRISYHNGAFSLPGLTTYEPNLGGNTWEDQVDVANLGNSVLQVTSPSSAVLAVTAQIYDVYASCFFNTTIYSPTAIPPTCGNEYALDATHITSDSYQSNFVDLVFFNIDDLFRQDDFVLAQCYVPCFQITSRLQCTETYKDICDWFIDESIPSPAMTCGNPDNSEATVYPALDASVACTNTTLYPDPKSCIQGGLDTACAFDRVTAKCTYFDLDFDTQFSAVMPCEYRMTRVVGFGACAGFDYDPSGIVPNAYDYCYFKQDSANTQCLPIVNTTYNDCYNPGVTCEFGFGVDGSLHPGEDLTIYFYADTAAERDAYLNPASVTDLCALYTSYPEECALKTVDGSGNAQCEFRGDVCTPLCSAFDGDAQGCVNNLPYSKCVYYINQTQCEDNIADFDTEPLCNSQNCATARDPCNLYYTNNSTCAADSSCTFLYSSVLANYTAHCTRKINVNLVTCYDSSGTAKSMCDVGTDVLTAENPALQTDCVIYAARDDFLKKCVEAIDPVSGLNCIGVQVSDVLDCQPPGSSELNRLQQTYGESLGVTTYYYGNFTDTSVAIDYVIFENTTYADLEPFLRTAYQSAPISTLGAKVTTVPDSAEGLYTFPCTSVGFVVVGDVCCPPGDVISVQQDTNVTTTQCLSPSSNANVTSFPNPAHPNNLYLTVSTALCALTNDTIYSDPVNKTFSVFYMAKLIPDAPLLSVDNNNCPNFWNTTQYTRDEYAGYMFIEEEMCDALLLCPRLVPSPCKVEIELDGKMRTMVRLDSNALGQLSYAQTYSLYNGEAFFLEFMRNAYSHFDSLAVDIIPSNITTLITDTMASKASTDIPAIFDINVARYGESALNWGVTPGEGVVTDRHIGQYKKGREVLKTDQAVFGFRSTDTIPVWQPYNPIYSCTGYVEIFEDNVLIDTIYSSNCIADDPYSGSLPTTGDHFVHTVDTTRGLVISPPLNKIDVDAEPRTKCGKIGYYHTYSSTNDNITHEEYLTANPDYDAECLVSPITFSSPIDWVAYNATGQDFCGKTFGVDFTKAAGVEAALNLRFLTLVDLVDEDGNPLDYFWRQYLNDNNTDLIERIARRISPILKGEGCVNEVPNFVDPYDATCETNCTVYFNIDKYRLWVLYAEDLINNSMMSFEDAMSDLTVNYLRPFAQAGKHPQCGNCGKQNGYQYDCAYLNLVTLPVNSGMSARGGLCAYTRFYDIDMDELNGILLFTANEATVQMLHTFNVPFPRGTQVVTLQSCPQNPIGFDCTPSNNNNALCTLRMFNPSSTSSLLVRVVVDSQDCPQELEYSIGAQASLNPTVLLCDGQVNLTVTPFSLNTTVCLFVSQTYNFTDIFQGIFDNLDLTNSSTVQSLIDQSIFTLSTQINSDLTVINNTLIQTVTLADGFFGEYTPEIGNNITLGKILNQTTLSFADVDGKITIVQLNITQLKNDAAAAANTTTNLSNDLVTLQTDVQNSVGKLTNSTAVIQSNLTSLRDDTTNHFQDIEVNNVELSDKIDNVTAAIDALKNSQGGALPASTRDTSIMAIAGIILSGLAFVGVVSVAGVMIANVVGNDGNGFGGRTVPVNFGNFA